MFPTGRKRKFSEQVVPVSPNLRDSLSTRRLSADSHYPATANPFDDASYPIPDFDRVYSLMRDPEKGLDLKDRRWKLLLYSKCFVGSEAVQWMVDNLSLDKKVAVSTGQRLMQTGIIHHVTHSEPFSDGYFYYRFQEDDDSNILNMKRLWDSALPTRDAVEVARDLLTRLAFLCEEHRKRILAPKLETPSASPNPAMSTSHALQRTPDLASRRHSMPAPASSPNLVRSYSTPPLMPSRPMHSPMLPTVPTASSPSLVMPSLPTHMSGDDVDYSTLAKSEDFRQYTLKAAELQRVQLVALNDDERIAFFINVYNALCLHAHVTQGAPTTILRRWTFFRVVSYRVAGLDMTLDDIEHGILRGNKRPPMIKFLQQLRPSDPKCQHVLTTRDGRIHFLISAGTKSDPPIRILDGENVQEELHHGTVEFLSCSVKIDMEKRCVTLPRIFLWYAEDFPTPEKSLLVWVAKYLPVEHSHQLLALVSEGPLPTVAYENFDWAIAEARFNASIVRRKRRKLERERSLPSEMQDGLDQIQMPPDPHPPFLSDASLPPVEDTFPGIPRPNMSTVYTPSNESPFPVQSDVCEDDRREEQSDTNIDNSGQGTTDTVSPLNGASGLLQGAPNPLGNT